MDDNYIFEWFRFGDRDLAVAEHSLSLHPQPYEIICYLCQQTVEKYLKGYLFFCGIKPPKTHELDRLCEMCAEHDGRFNELFEQCETLTVYGTQPRYPYEIEVNEIHMKKALVFANQIKNFQPLITVRQELEQALAQEQ